MLSAAVALTVGALHVAACGGDGAVVPRFTCLRQTGYGQQCDVTIEQDGNAESLDDAELDCTRNLGDQVDACPSAGIVGCCVYPSPTTVQVGTCFYATDDVDLSFVLHVCDDTGESFTSSI
jgi:hypothetical protein